MFKSWCTLELKMMKIQLFSIKVMFVVFKAKYVKYIVEIEFNCNLKIIIVN